MAAKKVKNLGIDVEMPKEECNDIHCPFHGSASLRGRNIIAKVVRAKVLKNALVEWNWPKYVPKYERYEKKRTRIMVHNPPCIKAEEGDTVRIMETRKISKTKSFVIVGRIQVGASERPSPEMKKNTVKTNKASKKGE